MTIDFYYVNASAPCRSVLLLAKALKIELNLKVTDLSKGDNKTPEFLKVQYKSRLLHFSTRTRALSSVLIKSPWLVAKDRNSDHQI